MNQSPTFAPTDALGSTSVEMIKPRPWSQTDLGPSPSLVSGLLYVLWPL